MEQKLCGQMVARKIGILPVGTKGRADNEREGRRSNTGNEETRENGPSEGEREM
jgi:hypothetical protein